MESISMPELIMLIRVETTSRKWIGYTPALPSAYQYDKTLDLKKKKKGFCISTLHLQYVPTCHVRLFELFQYQLR